MTNALLGDDITHTVAVDIRVHITAAPEDTQSFDGKDRSSVPTDPELAGGTTGSDSDPAIASIEKTDFPKKNRLLALPNVQFVQGRPDIKAILTSEIEGTSGAIGINGASISVQCTQLIRSFVVCGTTELAQSVRHSLRNGLERFMDVLRGGPSVLLHVEGFGSG